VKALVGFHLLFRVGNSIWFRRESLLRIDWCGAGISWVHAVSFGVRSDFKDERRGEGAVMVQYVNDIAPSLRVLLGVLFVNAVNGI